MKMFRKTLVLLKDINDVQKIVEAHPIYGLQYLTHLNELESKPESFVEKELKAVADFKNWSERFYATKKSVQTSLRGYIKGNERRSAELDIDVIIEHMETSEGQKEIFNSLGLNTSSGLSPQALIILLNYSAIKSYCYGDFDKDLYKECYKNIFNQCHGEKEELSELFQMIAHFFTSFFCGETGTQCLCVKKKAGGIRIKEYFDFQWSVNKVYEYSDSRHYIDTVNYEPSLTWSLDSQKVRKYKCNHHISSLYKSDSQSQLFSEHLQAIDAQINLFFNFNEELVDTIYRFLGVPDFKNGFLKIDNKNTFFVRQELNSVISLSFMDSYTQVYRNKNIINTDGEMSLEYITDYTVNNIFHEDNFQQEIGICIDGIKHWGRLALVPYTYRKPSECLSPQSIRSKFEGKLKNRYIKRNEMSEWVREQLYLQSSFKECDDEFYYLPMGRQLTIEAIDNFVDLNSYYYQG